MVAGCIYVLAMTQPGRVLGYELAESFLLVCVQPFDAAIEILSGRRWLNMLYVYWVLFYLYLYLIVLSLLKFDTKFSILKNRTVIFLAMFGYIVFSVGQGGPGRQAYPLPPPFNQDIKWPGMPDVFAALNVPNPLA